MIKVSSENTLNEIIPFKIILSHSKSLISFLFNKVPKTSPYGFKRLTQLGSVQKENTFYVKLSCPRI